MTVIATALKHMLAAGMSAEAIVEAVAAMEAALPAAEPADRPRSKAAERQARYRERHKASQTVTRDVDNVTGDEKRNGRPLPLSPKDINSNPHTPTRDNTPRVKAEAHVAAWWAWRVKHPFPRPHWAARDVWADFLTNRKRKDLPNTKSAHTKLLRDIIAAMERTGWPPGRIFEACVEQGWGAIYDTNEMKAANNGNNGNRNGAPRNSGQRGKQDGFQAACADDLADRQARRSSAGGTGDRRRIAAPGATSL